jgi:hypothetical protein
LLTSTNVAAIDVAMTVAGVIPAPPLARTLCAGLVLKGLRHRDQDYMRRAFPFTWPIPQECVRAACAQIARGASR